MFGQSVGSQAKEVVCICDQIPGGTVHRNEIDCVAVVRWLTRLFARLSVCLTGSTHPNSNPNLTMLNPIL